MRYTLLLTILLLIKTLSAQDTLTKADLYTGAKLAGLSFTEAEVDSLYETARGGWLEIKKLHGMDLPNSVPMSMHHRPDLVLAAKPTGTNIAPKFSLAPAVLPARRSDLAFYSVAQLSALVKGKKVSSVELTRLFIERIKQFGDTLECVISITEELAMQQARSADSLLKKGIWLGPLHGIPYGLKDLFAVNNTLTTWGAEPFKNQTIATDAAVYEKLRKSGAVLVAKFTLGALALGDRWYGGQTRNPWNLQRGSSGSSAGSASATVAGLVPFAIGTETWGSIISPASTCGATGLRPTFGRISRYGAMTLSWSLDKVGPLCRSAEDCAIVFAQLYGPDPRDGNFPNYPFDYTGKADFKKLRIGYAKNYFDRIPDTSRTEWKVLKTYERLGATLVPINFPDSAVYDANLMTLIIRSESSAAFEAFTRLGLDDQLTHQRRSDWPNSFRSGRLIPAVDYINANRQRWLLMEAVNKTMQTVDVLICPTFGSGNQSAITNLTGQPALCMPTGFDSRFGTPTSITLLANLYQEAVLLAVARAYQQATSWEDQHPEWLK